MTSAIAKLAIFPGAAVAQSADSVSLADGSVLATHIADTGAPKGGIVSMTSSGLVSLNDWTMPTGSKYLKTGSSYYVGPGGKLISGSSGQQIGIAASTLSLSVTIQGAIQPSSSSPFFNPAALEAQIAKLAASIPIRAVGTYAIGNGVDTGVISGLALSFVPNRFLITVRKPSGGLNLFATVVDGFTHDGFTFFLNGLTDSASYKIDWEASP